MSKTLQEVLDTDLSPDKVKEMDTEELIRYLLFNNVVDSKADVNMLIIEGIQKALNDDDEFPIRYYSKDQEMPEAGKVVDPGECLTDSYIENNMK